MYKYSNDIFGDAVTVEPNADAYLQSISDELQSKASRIRHLIGDAHFLTDGHHKEYLLKGVLERFLPQGMVCGRGFVVRDHELRFVSCEQDLLIVDVRRNAPLFFESGVIVTFPENVRAAISIKSKLGSATLSDAIKGLRSVPCIDSDRQPWLGIYAYTADSSWSTKPELAVRWLASRREAENNGADTIVDWCHGAICVDSEFFIRVRGNEAVQGYWCALSTALFVATIVEGLCEDTGRESRGIADLMSGTSFTELKY